MEVKKAVGVVAKHDKSHLATSTESMVSSVEEKSSMSALDCISMKAVCTFGSSILSWLTAASASLKPGELDASITASARASTLSLSSVKSKDCAWGKNDRGKLIARELGLEAECAYSNTTFT